MRRMLIIVLGTTLLFFASCVTSEKTTYLQDYPTSAFADSTFVPVDYHIQVGDNLFIRVVTPDPRWSEMFNTIPTAAAGVSVTAQSVDLLSYAVKPNGTVDIPYLGEVEIVGLTLHEVKEELVVLLEEYVTDPAITVKLVNNFISILGEVRAPGLYPIYKDQLNIFQALSMAGDINEYGNRYEVSILRRVGETAVVKEFDLTDKKILNSEFYYVMPNDVIYAKPMKGKFFAMNQFPFALILTSVTTFILVANYIQ